MPFGLKISPAIFQRALANILRHNNLQNFRTNYIDDILVFSKSFEEHVQHIILLLQSLRAEGFKIKLPKCELAKYSVKYLGHTLGYNTVSPHQDNLISIKQFPKPENKKNIRQFLGKVNFYNKYISNSTKLLSPLHNLLRENVKFDWTEECQKTFEKIKDYLSSSPILAIFDPQKKTYIFTDASIQGIGAILKQVQNNGELLPVAYFSKKLRPAQMKKKGNISRMFSNSRSSEILAVLAVRNPIHGNIGPQVLREFKIEVKNRRRNR